MLGMSNERLHRAVFGGDVQRLFDHGKAPWRFSQEEIHLASVGAKPRFSAGRKIPSRCRR